LSPFAAKRLWILLGAILKEYEKRFGSLGLDLPGGASTPVKSAGSGKPQ
jgi:murein DD-endopeptidase MepM/ murein hydrolase activator NlpD